MVPKGVSAAAKDETTKQNSRQVELLDPLPKRRMKGSSGRVLGNPDRADAERERKCWVGDSGARESAKEGDRGASD
jgi:hypothetical protein